MAGEIQLNSTSFASESSGTITINNATVGSGVVMAANQACVKTALNTSTSAPVYACRGWINFDGTSGSIGTGAASKNVASVTDNGTGDFTINWDTAMADANYATTIAYKPETLSNGAAPRMLFINSQSAASVNVKAVTLSNGTATDYPIICVAIFST